MKALIAFIFVFISACAPKGPFAFKKERVGPSFHRLENSEFVCYWFPNNSTKCYWKPEKTMTPAEEDPALDI